MKFTWDPVKAKLNYRSHRVAFEEAESVLKSGNRLYIVYDDRAGEERFKAIGYSEIGRCLVVIFCERGENTIRIISARKAEKKEVIQWHKEI